MFALLEAPRHGYELLKMLRERFGTPASQSQVYPFLNELKLKGFVSVSLGKRGKKTYSLTRKGAAFVAGLSNKFSLLITAAVKKKVKPCVHCGCRMYESGVLKAWRGKKLAFCCEHCAKTYFKNQKTYYYTPNKSKTKLIKKPKNLAKN